MKQRVLERKRRPFADLADCRVHHGSVMGTVKTAQGDATQRLTQIVTQSDADCDASDARRDASNVGRDANDADHNAR